MGEIFYLIVWYKRNNFVFKDGIQYPVCHYVAEKFIYPSLHVGKRSIYSKENLLETLITTFNYKLPSCYERGQGGFYRDIPGEFLEQWNSWWTSKITTLCRYLQIFDCILIIVTGLNKVLHLEKLRDWSVFSKNFGWQTLMTCWSSRFLCGVKSAFPDFESEVIRYCIVILPLL